jgi:hypothetical protein
MEPDLFCWLSHQRHECAHAIEARLAAHAAGI